MVFSIDIVKNLILTHYGISGNIEALPGEIDLNYLVQLPSGEKRTFKIANKNEKRENLEFQNAMMHHLASGSLGLQIPDIVPTLKGEYITHINDHEGKGRMIRMLTWVEGRPLAKVNPHTPELLQKIGAMCGKLSNSLSTFSHPAANRFIKWDLAQVTWIKPHIDKVADKRKKEILDYFYAMHTKLVIPELANLRKSVIYNDGNDYNVLVSSNLENPDVPGVIDFGDAVFSNTVNDLAITMAYALMEKPDPLRAGFHLVKGYNGAFQLEESEVKVLFPLIATRLIISVICSEINRLEEPDNLYLQVSDEPAWKLLEKLQEISPALAYYTFRSACGLEPCPLHDVFKSWLGKAELKPIIKDADVTQGYWLDLSMGSLDLGSQSEVLNDRALHQNIENAINQSWKKVGIGRYNEARPFYTSSAFKHQGNDGPEWRSVHIGVDLFLPEGTDVCTPLDAVVHSAIDNVGHRNYGPTIILKHEILPELTFYTLYGHLSRQSLEDMKPGRKLKAGDVVGQLGSIDENGGWSPHLHLQVILDLLDSSGDFPGVALPGMRRVWCSICPDPWLLIDKTSSPQSEDELFDEMISYRQSHLGKNLSLSYRKPLHIIRGYAQFLYDKTGRRFLDTVNNVAHVGHEHPRVVRAAQRQMAVLNTNTRYLHENIISFTKTLLSTLPEPLGVAFLVNSGSEANELALRIAKTYTGQNDMVVVEVGYHGNTNACVDVSSYKFDGKGGKGAPEHIQVVPIPDTFRGKYRDLKTAGKEYASHVETAIRNIKSKGRGLAGFIAESVLSCGGQIVLPDGYLREAYKLVHNAGGVCIADEVQTGCGRIGSHFWAFETQNVVPDIVTIGKPIGNGHPLGVVVTTRKLADAFANGMEYFSTFGGNPVSSIIGNEVLQIVKDEGLQENALKTGKYLTKGLLELKRKYPIIGDVRGYGLFLGIELIKNKNLDPATKEAAYLANRMRELGVLMSTDGPYENVMKIKPPMVFNESDCDLLISTLSRVLDEDYMKAGFRE